MPLEELETCKSIKELLRKLDKYYDFLDCDVLTTLAKQFATPTLFQKFQEHSEAAINFASLILFKNFENAYKIYLILISKTWPMHPKHTLICTMPGLNESLMNYLFSSSVFSYM